MGILHSPSFPVFLNSGLGLDFLFVCLGCLGFLVYFFSELTPRRKTKKNFWGEFYHVLKRIGKFCRKQEGRWFRRSHPILLRKIFGVLDLCFRKYFRIQKIVFNFRKCSSFLLNGNPLKFKSP